MTKYLQPRTLLVGALVAGCLGAASLAGPTIDFWNDDDQTRRSDETKDSRGSDRVDSTLSILTFNLKTGALVASNVDRRSAAVRRFIEDEQPDVVALQEVSSRTGVHSNIGEKIAKRTGYEIRWKRTHSLPWLYDEGLAILSRWPISWSASQTLPHPEAPGLLTRAVLGARIQHPRQAFEVFVTHMTTADEADIKVEQIEAVASFVERHSKSPSSWLVGDFNAEPDSKALEALRSFDASGTSDETWVDAWSAARPDAPGATVPAHRPEYRIDYIFTVRHPTPSSAARCEHVFDTELDNMIGDVYPSDHLGVYCSFPLGVEFSDRSTETSAGVR